MTKLRDLNIQNGRQLSGFQLDELMAISQNPGDANCISITGTTSSNTGKPIFELNGNAKTSSMGNWSANRIVANANDIANSRYSGSGYQTPLDTLTALSPRLMEQMMMKESELAAIVPTLVGEAPYMETRKFEVGGNVAGLASEHQISVNHNGVLKGVDRNNTFYNSERKVYAWSINYTILEMRQGNASGIQTFTLERRMNGAMDVINQHLEQLRAFGTQRADGSRAGGMFNYREAVINTSIFPNSFNAMTSAQMKKLAKDLAYDFNTNNDIGEDFTDLILPSLDSLALGTVDETYTGGIVTYKDLLTKSLQDATGKDINIILSKYASKAFNAKMKINGGIGQDIFFAVNRDYADIFFDVPVNVQMLMQPAEVGMGVQIIYIAQVGDVVVGRPELARIYQ
jgi:hypothetical protein